MVIGQMSFVQMRREKEELKEESAHKPYKMQTEKLTKDEKSLLLFLETRQVDYGGRVNLQHMNDEDMEIAERWNKEGFIGFGRIVIRNHNSDGTHWCRLSKEAFEVAHELRKERAERMWLNRTWLGTKESMEMNGSPHLSGMNQIKEPNKLLFIPQEEFT